MLKGVGISKGQGNAKGKGKFIDTSASFSGGYSHDPQPPSPTSEGDMSSGISSFDRGQLKPTTTKVTTVGDLISKKPAVDPSLVEHHDEPEVLLAKVKELADLVRSSQYTVAFTGAGISSSAGLATYRGPDGVWTRRDQGLPAPKSSKLAATLPTPAHMALVELFNQKALKHIVSTNVDGLHRRSGISEADLSELHGNCYKENCKNCRKEYFRKFDATERGTRSDHLTGRNCDVCQGPLGNLPSQSLSITSKHDPFFLRP